MNTRIGRVFSVTGDGYCDCEVFFEGETIADRRELHLSEIVHDDTPHDRRAFEELNERCRLARRTGKTVGRY